jgi:hypothetical protein
MPVAKFHFSFETASRVPRLCYYSQCQNLAYGPHLSCEKHMDGIWWSEFWNKHIHHSARTEQEILNRTRSRRRTACLAARSPGRRGDEMTDETKRKTLGEESKLNEECKMRREVPYRRLAAELNGFQLIGLMCCCWRRARGPRKPAPVVLQLHKPS